MPRAVGTMEFQKELHAQLRIRAAGGRRAATSTGPPPDCQILVRPCPTLSPSWAATDPPASQGLAGLWESQMWLKWWASGSLQSWDGAATLVGVSGGKIGAHSVGGRAWELCWSSTGGLLRGRSTCIGDALREPQEDVWAS